MFAKARNFVVIVYILCHIVYSSGFEDNEISEKKCSDGEFLCQNEICVDSSFTCDDENDCGDFSDENITCGWGCERHGTLYTPGSVVEDKNWWYMCKRARWRIRGCMVKGRRVLLGETFFGYMNEFWGRCEMLGVSYVRRHLKGCMDYKDTPVLPAMHYLTDPFFWAVCSDTKRVLDVPGEGKMAINTVKRKIVGCFDGSPNPVPNDEQFINITDVNLNMGVAYQCQTDSRSQWPEVVPVACVIGNNTLISLPDYIGIGHGCYVEVDNVLYFCTISNQSEVTVQSDSQVLNGSWKYSWEIRWNVTNPDVISQLLDELHRRNYKLCNMDAKSGRNQKNDKVIRKSRSADNQVLGGRVFGDVGNAVKPVLLETNRIA